MSYKVLILLLAILLLAVMVTPVLAAPPAEPDTQTAGQVDDASSGEEESGSTADTFGEIFGTLGLFAAMMAVLALGAEVVIDTVKVGLGLKSKPTALAAFEKYRNELPGQLRDLGATKEAEGQLTNLISSLKGTLEPVEEVQEITADIKNGDIEDALTKAESLLEGTTADPDEVQKAITDGLDRGLGAIFDELRIPPSVANAIKAEVVSVAGELLTAESISNLLDALQQQGVELSIAWVQTQVGTLADGGVTAVMRLFDEQLAPQLKNFGLKDNDIETIRTQVESALEEFKDEAISGLVHLDALRELMQAVEDRRQEIQSPPRKVWRWVRNIPILGHGLATIPQTEAWRLLRRVPILGPRLPATQRIGWLEAAGYPGGVGLLTWPEAVINWAMKRQPQDVECGEAEPVEPFTASTLASRLLRAENLHRDQEASRLRALRVISVFVGVWLAYVTQVNLVDILSGAFDGLAKINEIVSTAIVVGWLNWPLRLLNWLPFISIKLIEPSVTDGVATLGNGMRLDAGIVLSGLAASAGSAFWHDQLDRLQIAKKVTGQVQTVVETVRATTQEG